jgi:hypothetical protein
MAPLYSQPACGRESKNLERTLTESMLGLSRFGFRIYSDGMELREEKARPTLAQKLGDVTHVSPLLRRIRELSGCPEERVAEWLLKCAVARGASHYEREFAPDLPADNPALTNEELGVALCLGHHPFDPMLIRAAAQLLSAPDTNPETLARLAVMERCEPILLHIAQAPERVAPAQEPWAVLRADLSNRHRVRVEALPHWSRFVSQTGVTAFGGPPRIDWLCRARPAT